VEAFLSGFISVQLDTPERAPEWATKVPFSYAPQVTVLSDFCLTIYGGEVALVTNYAPHHDDVWGSGGTASVVRSLGAILLLLLLLLFRQLSFHSVAVVLTLVLTKQMRIDVIGQLYAPDTLPRESSLGTMM